MQIRCNKHCGKWSCTQPHLGHSCNKHRNGIIASCYCFLQCTLQQISKDAWVTYQLRLSTNRLFMVEFTLKLFTVKEEVQVDNLRETCGFMIVCIFTDLMKNWWWKSFAALNVLIGLVVQTSVDAFGHQHLFMSYRVDIYCCADVSLYVYVYCMPIVGCLLLS